MNAKKSTCNGRLAACGRGGTHLLRDLRTVDRVGRNDFRPQAFEVVISISSIVGASDRDLLDQNKVTHILTVANHIAPFWPEVSASRMILNADHITLSFRNHSGFCIQGCRGA